MKTSMSFYSHVSNNGGGNGGGFFSSDGRSSAAARTKVFLRKNEADDCVLNKVNETSATLKRYEEKSIVSDCAKLSPSARKALKWPTALLETGTPLASADSKKHIGGPQHRYVPRP